MKHQIAFLLLLLLLAAIPFKFHPKNKEEDKKSISAANYRGVVGRPRRRRSPESSWDFLTYVDFFSCAFAFDSHFGFSMYDLPFIYIIHPIHPIYQFNWIVTCLEKHSCYRCLWQSRKVKCWIIQMSENPDAANLNKSEMQWRIIDGVDWWLLWLCIKEAYNKSRCLIIPDPALAQRNRKIPFQWPSSVRTRLRTWAFLFLLLYIPMYCNGRHSLSLHLSRSNLFYMPPPLHTASPPTSSSYPRQWVCNLHQITTLASTTGFNYINLTAI